MAGIKMAAVTAPIVSGTALITLLQIVAAANHRVLVKEISISFDGTTNTAVPILVQVARQSTAGTMSALTINKVNEDDGETLQTTALHTATVEPTTGVEVLTEYVHPQAGYTWQAPYDEKIVINGGDRLGVLINADATVNCVVRMFLEE